MTAAARPPSAGDRALLQVAWSLGWATTGAVAGLAVPPRALEGTRVALQRLRADGLVRTVRLPQGPAHHRLLHAVTGRAAAVDPGLAAGWRPPLAAAWHSVDVGLALLAALDPRLAPPVVATAWCGEAELRAWAVPGAPYADARVDFRVPGGGSGRCWLEIDRGTEGRPAWRRKLVAYLDRPQGEVAFALTTGERRARHLAELAVELGAPLLSCPLPAFRARGDPAVYCARQHRRLALSAALLAGARAPRT